jgi:hypothetical protein
VRRGGVQRTLCTSQSSSILAIPSTRRTSCAPASSRTQGPPLSLHTVSASRSPQEHNQMIRSSLAYSATCFPYLVLTRLLVCIAPNITSYDRTLQVVHNSPNSQIFLYQSCKLRRLARPYVFCLLAVLSVPLITTTSSLQSLHH